MCADSLIRSLACSYHSSSSAASELDCSPAQLVRWQLERVVSGQSGQSSSIKCRSPFSSAAPIKWQASCSSCSSCLSYSGERSLARSPEKLAEEAKANCSQRRRLKLLAHAQCARMRLNQRRRVVFGRRRNGATLAASGDIRSLARSASCDSQSRAGHLSSALDESASPIEPVASRSRV